MVSKVVPQRSSYLARLFEELSGVRAFEKGRFATKAKNATQDLEQLREIWRRYERWLKSAEAHVQNSPDEELAELNEEIERVRTRLTLNPDEIARAKEQINRGEAVPAKELRDELNAKFRA